MKIGIDARFFGTSGKGLGRYTEKLIRSLETLDQENQYVIFLYGEAFDEYQPTNKNFTKVKVGYRWYGWSEQILYPFFLKKQNLDLIHFPHFNVPLLYRRRFVVTVHDLILLHFPTKKASTHHSVWYWFKYLMYLGVIKSAIRRAETVLAVSQFTKEDIEKFYPQASKKIYVTLEGVDQYCFWLSVEQSKKILEGYWKKIGRNEDRPYALYVGNSYPHKNLEQFLFLATHTPETDIVLVGKKDYFYSQLEAEIQKRNIQNIYLLGAVTDYDLSILYRFSRVYVFPSLYEGFGLPPLEAMQYSLPVLVSNRGSLPEIVGSAAAVIDPEEEGEFLAAYKELLENNSLRENLQHAGWERAQKFSWRAMAEATKDIYTKDIKH